MSDLWAYLKEKRLPYFTVRQGFNTNRTQVSCNGSPHLEIPVNVTFVRICNYTKSGTLDKLVKLLDHDFGLKKYGTFGPDLLNCVGDREKFVYLLYPRGTTGVVTTPLTKDNKYALEFIGTNRYSSRPKLLKPRPSGPMIMNLQIDPLYADVEEVITTVLRTVEAAGMSLLKA